MPAVTCHNTQQLKHTNSSLQILPTVAGFTCLRRLVRCPKLSMLWSFSRSKLSGSTADVEAVACQAPAGHSACMSRSLTQSWREGVIFTCPYELAEPNKGLLSLACRRKQLVLATLIKREERWRPIGPRARFFHVPLACRNVGAS